MVRETELRLSRPPEFYRSEAPQQAEACSTKIVLSGGTFRPIEIRFTKRVVKVRMLQRVTPHTLQWFSSKRKSKPPQPPLGKTNNMEKSSTNIQESTASKTIKAAERTTEEELHARLPTNNSTTMNRTTHHEIPHSPRPAQQSGETTPSTPQHNPIHSTMTHNRSTHHTTGRDAPVSTAEQPMGIQAPNQGISGHMPHKDGSTQMPSQEIHLITINESTQMPS